MICLGVLWVGNSWCVGVDCLGLGCLELLFVFSGDLVFVGFWMVVRLLCLTLRVWVHECAGLVDCGWIWWGLVVGSVAVFG